MKHLYAIILLGCMAGKMYGQHAYGTTGLLYAPTAEMQKDKTFMMGGNMIDHNTYRDSYWNAHDEYSPYTFNYYLNITIFPWLEVAYTCTLVKGIRGSSYWPPQTWGKFTNQDRSFHFRLRAWKEGWWKSWTPQIVLGANDPGSHESAGGGNITFQDVGESTNHLTRFYLAVTKHLTFERWGTLGVHASVIQFDGLDFDNDHGVTVGVDYRFRYEGGEGEYLVTDYDLEELTVQQGHALSRTAVAPTLDDEEDSGLHLRFFDDADAEEPVRQEDNLPVLMERNKITYLQYLYDNGAGEAEVRVWLDDHWEVLHNLSIEK